MVLSDINTVLLRFVIQKSKLSFPFLYLGYIVDNFHPETPAQEVRVNGILNGWFQFFLNYSDRFYNDKKIIL